MPDVPILLFAGASLALILTPGQDMLVIMSRSIAHGPRAGLVTAAGVCTGLLGHTLLAALGLGALLQASELLFVSMKILGAVYLVHLGIATFRAPPLALERQVPEGRQSLGDYFLQGAMSNLANPKVAIFFFAFLPQFVSPADPQPTATLLLLGCLLALLTLAVKGPIACAAGALSAWLRGRERVQVWLNRVSGTVLAGLGVRLAFSQSPAG